jgi:hypothetical protein
MATKTLEPLVVSKEEYYEILDEINKRNEPSHQPQYSEAYIRTVKHVIARSKNSNRRQLGLTTSEILYR